MSERRIDHLLRRELDGELTRVESEELERLLLSEPEARAERRGWRRVESSLGALQSQKLDVESMARVIEQRRRQVSPAQRREPLIPRFSAVFALAALCTAALIVWRTEPHSPPPISAAAPRVEERVPVEVHLTDRAPETGLVTIRF